MAESASGLDEANPAFWLVTQVGKMGSGFPALVPQEKVLQTIATEQFFPVVLFIMLYKVFLTIESVDEILKWGYSSKSYRAVLSYGVEY